MPVVEHGADASAAMPQPKRTRILYHESTRVTKEDSSRKGAKGAKEKQIKLCELGSAKRFGADPSFGGVLTRVNPRVKELWTIGKFANGAKTFTYSSEKPCDQPRQKR